MQLGNLDWQPARDHLDLLAAPVAEAIGDLDAYAVAIDADLADTAEFCKAYEVPLEASANCVVVQGKRGDRITTAAVMILASDRADINNVVRKHIDTRKASFLSMDQATSLTSMEYGGITPIGLPADWLILVDQGVVDAGWVVIGSGIRGSKIAIRGSDLLSLPNAEALTLALP